MTRRLVHGTKEPIAGVTTRKDGTFTFEDPPPDLGEVTCWAAKTLHHIMVE
ncbi:hypothetical protein ACFSTC_38620 [Nonomuraea ferruginea]